MDTIEVTEAELAAFCAAERKALDDFWAAEHEMQKLDRLRNNLRDNKDFQDIYQSALLRFYAAKSEAIKYGVLL